MKYEKKQQTSKRERLRHIKIKYIRIDRKIKMIVQKVRERANKKERNRGKSESQKRRERVVWREREKKRR